MARLPPGGPAPRARTPSRRGAGCMINPREPLMSLPRGVGSLEEPPSRYPAGVRSDSLSAWGILERGLQLETRWSD